MSKKFWNSLLAGSVAVVAALAVVGSEKAVAQSVETNNTGSSEEQLLDRLENYSRESNEKSAGQVTNVNQLRDVAPTDWAFEALQSLVERYGCIAGFPNQTYRGSKALSRYEFAAGLNACMNQIERLVASNQAIMREDLDKVLKLSEEFQAELATLGTKVDNLEGRVAFLEDKQFSTTTKLSGEVVFGLAQEFNTDGNQAVLQDRVRLDFVSSFTGKDKLHTRIAAGNSVNFNNVDQGSLTYNFPSGNDISLDWLAYYFPIGEKLEVYLPAAFPLWVDFVPSISPYLDAFTGATGALSNFGESSPIYKIGLSAGGGVGLNYNLNDQFVVSAGYFGGNSFNPTEGNGLFNGEYSALGQLTWKPNDNIQVAATYVNAYFNQFNDDPDSTLDGNAIFDLGVGTGNARAPFGSGNDVSASTNSFGLAASYKFSPKIAINAYGGYTKADEEGGSDSDAEILYYGVGLAFPDLGKEGNLGGIIVGAEPYVNDCEGSACVTNEDDIALHVEGFYKYQLNENISITPGVIWVNAPQGNEDNDDGIIGVVRTTFTF
jgi:Carbohydrate-selective porin, OprB family/S-layer homology domain